MFSFYLFLQHVLCFEHALLSSTVLYLYLDTYSLEITWNFNQIEPSMTKSEKEGWTILTYRKIPIISPPPK